ncbi:MAG TPA: hypothetical protein VGH33_07100 [Isosphaeraceae bacterium]
MARDKRTRRGSPVGVERLDSRISLSAFRPYAYFAPAVAPTPAHLPHSPLQPTAPPGTIAHVPPGSYGLS